jgi:hypothetical protein
MIILDLEFFKFIREDIWSLQEAAIGMILYPKSLAC